MSQLSNVSVGTRRRNIIIPKSKLMSRDNQNTSMLTKRPISENVPKREPDVDFSRQLSRFPANTIQRSVPDRASTTINVQRMNTQSIFSNLFVYVPSHAIRQPIVNGLVDALDTIVATTFHFSDASLMNVYFDKQIQFLWSVIYQNDQGKNLKRIVFIMMNVELTSTSQLQWVATPFFYLGEDSRDRVFYSRDQIEYVYDSARSIYTNKYSVVSNVRYNVPAYMMIQGMIESLLNTYNVSITSIVRKFQIFDTDLYRNLDIGVTPKGQITDYPIVFPRPKQPFEKFVSVLGSPISHFDIPLDYYKNFDRVLNYSNGYMYIITDTNKDINYIIGRLVSYTPSTYDWYKAAIKTPNQFGILFQYLYAENSREDDFYWVQINTLNQVSNIKISKTQAQQDIHYILNDYVVTEANVNESLINKSQDIQGLDTMLADIDLYKSPNKSSPTSKLSNKSSPTVDSVRKTRRGTPIPPSTPYSLKPTTIINTPPSVFYTQRM